MGHGWNHCGLCTCVKRILESTLGEAFWDAAHVSRIPWVLCLLFFFIATLSRTMHIDTKRPRTSQHPVNERVPCRWKCGRTKPCPRGCRLRQLVSKGWRCLPTREQRHRVVGIITPFCFERFQAVPSGSNRAKASLKKRHPLRKGNRGIDDSLLQCCSKGRALNMDYYDYAQMPVEHRSKQSESEGQPRSWRSLLLLCPATLLPTFFDEVFCNSHIDLTNGVKIEVNHCSYDHHYLNFSIHATQWDDIRPFFAIV